MNDKIKDRDNDFLYNKCVNQYHQLMNCQYKNRVYKQRIDKAVEGIQYIIDYGFDYDGFNTVESLKGLIDMLVYYALKSKYILQGNDLENKGD